jgi:predicted permease
MGVAVVVLLIACANVANLLLARARRRRHEVAVRVALGAGAARVARFVLAETIVLTLIGFGVAIGIALGGGKLMRATLLSSVAWEGSAVDARVLGFTLIVAIVAVMVVGFIPALDAARVSVIGSLKSERGGSAARARLRATLSILQAALCVILLIGAGLFVSSLANSRRVPLGFQPDRVVRVNPRFTGFGDLPKEAVAAARERRRLETLAIVDRLATMPFVEQAAVAVGTPFGNGFGLTLKIPGRDSIPQLPGGGPYIAAVSPSYFATMGTRLVRGRLFELQDTPASALVTIINETMAATLWPGEDPIGKCIIMEAPPCAQVVGIVADVHRSGLREPPSMQHYIPFGQERGYFGGTAWMVRPRGDIRAAMPSIRQALLQMPEVPSFSLETMQEAIDPEYRPWKLGAAMFGVFGILALIVAGVGLYSVVAYLVTDRTRELGVRIALGASGGRILRDVVVSGVATTMVGVALGIGVSLAAARFIEPLLFDVPARNPAVYGVVAVLVLAIAALAAWSPARRASRVDPVIALRAD